MNSKQNLSHDWFIHVYDEDKRLYVSRAKLNLSGAFSPCNMSPDDVDYEMSQGKDKRILEICGMNQESLEYFAEKYGESYEVLHFFKCQLISDFSPLAKSNPVQIQSSPKECSTLATFIPLPAQSKRTTSARFVQSGSKFCTATVLSMHGFAVTVPIIISNRRHLIV